MPPKEPPLLYSSWPLLPPGEPPPEPQVVVATTPVALMERQGFPDEPRLVMVRLEVVALPEIVTLPGKETTTPDFPIVMPVA